MAKQDTAQSAKEATNAVATQANTAAQKKETVKSLLDSINYQKRLGDLLKDRAPQFITSVIQLVNQDKQLADCEPNSVINAALVATSLDLQITKSLGYAYVIPYNNKQPDGTWRKEAQFQLGYKGYKQLAQRTGRFELLHQTDVREGELIEINRLTGQIKFNWEQDSAKRLALPVIGYVSYFELKGGFSSTFYMSVAELEAHAAKYSKTYAQATSKWKTDFSAMALKTVTKLNLDKNAPLSVEDKSIEALRLAIRADQAVVNDFENGGFSYPDNDTQDAEFTEVSSAQSKADAALAATENLLQNEDK